MHAGAHRRDYVSIFQHLIFCTTIHDDVYFFVIKYGAFIFSASTLVNSVQWKTMSRLNKLLLLLVIII